MSSPPIRRWDRETALLAWLAACVSIFSFLFYFRRGDILLYGDAVAHINIARRVFDSRTPGSAATGHGVAAAAASADDSVSAFRLDVEDGRWRIDSVDGSLCFRDARNFPIAARFADSVRTRRDVKPRRLGRGDHLCREPQPDLSASHGHDRKLCTWRCSSGRWCTSASLYGRQRSPGDGSDVRTGSSSLTKCGICLAAACLTRYDAWFLAVAMCAASLWVVVKTNDADSGASVRKFVLLAAAAPVIWLAYNAIVYRNPLEFANGPYSAKAIEQRTPGASHPGSHDLPVAFSYFLKSAELNLAAGNWQKLWIVLALAGTIVCLLGGRTTSQSDEGRLRATARRYWPLLLLWMPLPFYVLSVGL